MRCVLVQRSELSSYAGHPAIIETGIIRAELVGALAKLDILDDQLLGSDAGQ